MDAKITRQRIEKHLEYDWIKYIVILLVAVLGWIFIYDALDNPKDYEMISFFVSVNAYYSDENEGYGETNLKNQVNEALAAHDDNVIRNVSINYFADEIQYSTSALLNDFFVCEVEYITRLDYVLLELTDEVLALIGINRADYEFYYAQDQNGVTRPMPCAIRLKGSRLIEWLPASYKKTTDSGEVDTSQTYYIGIIGPNMIGSGNNIGQFNNGKASKEYGQSFYILKRILEYYKD